MYPRFLNRIRDSRKYLFGAGIAFALLLAFAIFALAYSSQALDTAGYVSLPSFGPAVVSDPTGEKPESKLWWNEQGWWGVLWNPEGNGGLGAYQIYKLDWSTQNWETTGTEVEIRSDAKLDVLWDGTHLYIASRFYAVSGKKEDKDSTKWARLYKYFYSPIPTPTYTIVPEFAAAKISEYTSENLVVDKDTSGRLWATFVSRDSNVAKVFINYTPDPLDHNSWNTEPISLSEVPAIGSKALVSGDDISSLITFSDDGGNKIGVMWSHNGPGDDTNKFFFATLLESGNPLTDWSVTALDPASYPFKGANDHINLAKTASGKVLAAVKTNENTLGSDPVIGLFVRHKNGAFDFYSVAPFSGNETRPLVVVRDDGDPNTTAEEKAYIFYTSKESGGVICYQSTSLTDIELTSKTCKPRFTSSAIMFIGNLGGSYQNFNNPTSTKGYVTDAAGVVVLAADDVAKVYGHSVLDGPEFLVISRSPGIDASGVSTGSPIQARFNKDVDVSTLTPSNFQVTKSGAPLAGIIGYEPSTRTAVFTPNSLLELATSYTVTLKTGVKATSGQALSAPQTWSFTTAGEVVIIDTFQTYLPISIHGQ